MGDSGVLHMKAVTEGNAKKILFLRQQWEKQNARPSVRSRRCVNHNAFGDTIHVTLGPCCRSR